MLKTPEFVKVDVPTNDRGSRRASFDSLEAWAREAGEPERRSGRQEMLENILNSYL